MTQLFAAERCKVSKCVLTCVCQLSAAGDWGCGVFWPRCSSAERWLGNALMDKVIVHTRQRGENRIYLGSSTISAQDFYRKLGFAEIGTGTFSHGASTVALEIVQME